VFYDPNRFAFTERLEQHWRAIYEEYLLIRGDLMDWHEKELYGSGWKIFGLFDFPRGQAIEANTAKCPFTSALVTKHVRNHGAVGFSVLKPRTKIKPHQGYQGEFLRCHLGLEVPDGDCALSVAGQTMQWRAGKVLVFDDRVTHEAWNLTDEERIILLVDFIPET
jgi:aspartyl/asparaginyl beta-hydroxylase (cupin superfamily)